MASQARSAAASVASAMGPAVPAASTHSGWRKEQTCAPWTSWPPPEAMAPVRGIAAREAADREVGASEFAAGDLAFSELAPGGAPCEVGRASISGPRGVPHGAAGAVAPASAASASGASHAAAGGFAPGSAASPGDARLDGAHVSNIVPIANAAGPREPARAGLRGRAGAGARGPEGVGLREPAGVASVGKVRRLRGLTTSRRFDTFFERPV